MAIVLIALSFLSVKRLLASGAVTQSYSVIVARPIVATSTTILFSFLLGQDIAPSSTMKFSFAPSYTVPGSVLPSDGSLSVNGGPKTLGTTSGNGVYGYAMNAGQLVLTTAHDETIPSGSTVQLLVGADGGFVTPSVTGTALFSTHFYGPSSTDLGYSEALTILVSPIGVHASSTATNPQAQVVNVLPELRVGPSDTNDDVLYYLTARQSGAVLFTQTPSLSTDNTGYSTSSVTFTGLSDGSYDIGIKTQQHLTRILRAVPLTSATTTLLNFTDPANGTATGTLVLLGGDIDAAGTNGFGDDTVNSVDMSILLHDLDDDDPTGNALRSNINQDDVVNSVDLSIMLKNLDAQGDR